MSERNVAESTGHASIAPDAEAETTGASGPAHRRAYRKPTVTDFGTITKLTQNGNGSGADGGTMGAMAMMCL